MPSRTATSLFKNVTALSAGQIASRALAIVYVAALARYIQPEGMGQLGTAQSLTALLFLFVNLGFDTFATRDVAQDKSRGTSYLSNLLWIKSALAFLALIVLAVICHFAHYGSTGEKVILAYGLVTALNAFIAIGNSILRANERLELEAIFRLGRDVLNIGLSLLVIALGGTLLQIVWISVLSNALHWMVVIIALFRLGMVTPKRPDRPTCLHLLQKGFPFNLAYLSNAVANQAGPVFLSLLATEAMTGAYWSAYNLLMVLFIIPSMYSQAVLPVFAKFESERNERLASSYQKSYKLLTSLGVPLMAGTILLAEPMTRLLYGPGYQDSVIALQILAVNLALAGNYASGPLLTALGKQKLLASLSGVSLLIMAGLYLWLVPLLGIAGASLAYTLPGVVGFVIFSVICHRLLRLSFPLGMFLRVLGATAWMSVCVYLGQHVGIPFLLLGILVGPIAYAAVLYLCGGLDESEINAFKAILNVHKQTA